MDLGIHVSPKYTFVHQLLISEQARESWPHKHLAEFTEIVDLLENDIYDNGTSTSYRGQICRCKAHVRHPT